MSHSSESVPVYERGADWRDLGLCRTHPEPELWFPIGASPAAHAQTGEAKAICRQCPVIQRCWQWSVENQEPVGVWGAMSEKERRVFLRRRGVHLPADPDDTDTGTTA